MDTHASSEDKSVEPQADRGNFVLGFALGCLLGLLPVIIILFVGGPDTKRGGLWGLGARFAVLGVGILIALW